jgi:hypothetical protein
MNETLGTKAESGWMDCVARCMLALVVRHFQLSNDLAQVA